jgi:hypothetical protein
MNALSVRLVTDEHMLSLPTNSVADPGWKEIQIQDPGSRKNIPDLIFENFFV